MNRNLLIGIAAFVLSAGAGCFGQIPPGYYNNAYGLQGEPLKAALHNIINGHVEYSYSATKEMLKETNEDPDNTDNVILIYTGRSQAKSAFGGGPNDWNREHVWAKSHGGFGDDPPCGTDLHHICPADASVNSDRGNKDFDNGGQQHPEATGCYYTAYTWEPRDEVKGDVARMILYMDVRYEGGGGEPDLTAVDAINTSPAPEHGRLSTLLAWHVLDPPDAFEVNRNNVIYSYQQNRNPFIDHPEFVGLIWDPPANIPVASATHNISIYPVPAGDNITLSGNMLKNASAITLININGAIIQTFTGSIANSETVTLDISGISNGIYVLQIISDGTVIREKITRCR